MVKTSIDYREEYGYMKEFQISLGTAFKRDPNDPRFDFYDNLADALEDLGKKTFVPYRDINHGWSKKKIRDIITNIVVPSSDLVLADVKIPDYISELIVSRASELEIPFISFFTNFSYEEARKLLLRCRLIEKECSLEELQREWEVVKRIAGRVVELENDKDGLEKMVDLVKEFYGIC